MPDPSRHGLLALPGDDSHGTLYCLLDAASGTAVYPTLQDCAAEEYIASLYTGAAATDLAAVAPYLAAPEAGGKLIEWVSGAAWTTAWGVFLWSDAPFEDVRNHFRRLSKVRTEDGRTLLFRFYDPRVLSAFLPTCDAAQLREVFGEVTRFGIPVAAEPAIDVFTHQDGTLERTRLAV